MSNYLEKLLASTAVPLTHDAVTIATVAHDDWCLLLNGKGECNCDPEISYRAAPPPPARTGSR
jgi:hypothetical protein